MCIQIANVIKKKIEKLNKRQAMQIIIACNQKFICLFTLFIKCDSKLAANRVSDGTNTYNNNTTNKNKVRITNNGNETKDGAKSASVTVTAVAV